MSTTTTNGNGFSMDAVIEAMRGLHDENDRWNLAEVLRLQIPDGLTGFSEIIDRATSEGVAAGLSANTLRLYRDTAKVWPADKRVKGLSFSAHRTAQPMIEDKGIDATGKMLRDLAKQHGAGNVTVKRVREAVAVAAGKPVPGSKGKAANTAKGFDVLDDIAKGSTQLIAAIVPATDADQLDKLHAGLTKAIGHVERLRAKAARKAAGATKAAPSKATPKGAATAKTASRKAAGDLRGL